MEKKRSAPLCRQPIGRVRSLLQLQQRQREPRRFPARWLRLWRETIGAWILPEGLAEKRTGHLQKQPLQRTDRTPSAPGPEGECR